MYTYLIETIKVINYGREKYTTDNSEEREKKNVHYLEKSIKRFTSKNRHIATCVLETPAAMFNIDT